MSQKEEWSMEELTTTLNDTARTDKDNQIAVDGPTGSGKSTVAIKMAIKGCPWFDMQRDILYSKQEIIEWVTTARPGSWGVADEAVNALFKRDFAARTQKFLLKILDMCRDRNLTLLFCIPNFWALDKHVLDGRLRLRIHVAKTGMAFLWKPTGNPFSPDKWSRKYNEFVCRNWDYYPNAKRSKGFIGYLKFGDLAGKYKEEYLQIKAKKKQMLKEQEEKEEREGNQAKKRSVEFGKTMMLSFLMANGLLRPGAFARIAEFEGIDKSAISHRVKLFREKNGEDSKGCGEEDEHTIQYMYDNNNQDFNQNDTQIGHSAK